MPKGIYPRKPRTKITSMEQLDGKLREDIKTPRTLDEIMGIHETTKYKTSDPEQYQAYLSQLNNTDLWAHANTVGLGPNHDLPKLKRDLIAEHARYFRTKPHQGGQQRLSVPENQISDEVRRILAEGR